MATRHEPGMRLPDELELLALLGEPRVEDAEQPWRYNHLVFVTGSNRDEVEIQLWPSHGDMQVHWEKGGVSLVSLQLAGVDGLYVETEKGREYLVVGFEEDSRIRPPRIQLRPRVSIYWGTETWP